MIRKLQAAVIRTLRQVGPYYTFSLGSWYYWGGYLLKRALVAPLVASSVAFFYGNAGADSVRSDLFIENLSMRLLIISDIHANLAAFEAVLADAADQWDQIWCLGDIVGYGPNPNECASLLRQYDHISLCGNHDWAVLGKLEIRSFNAEARAAIEWTRRALTEETRDYLNSLSPSFVTKPFTLAHGSPRQPIWEYILDRNTAAANFAYFDTPYCFVGHTHVAIVFEQPAENRTRVHAPNYDEPLALGKERLIINPGSVGQPRDSDPRAAYALLDTESLMWEHRRVAYPIEQTQEEMRRQDFPYRLIARLEYGW